MKPRIIMAMRLSADFNIVNNRAQSLLELAVFGSLLLMLLGVLINYGLRYDAQVNVMQAAFRKALFYASRAIEPDRPIGVSYALVKDVHIPNPTDTWALGQTNPVSSSAMVTRSYALHVTPSDPSDLPITQIEIQGYNVVPNASNSNRTDFRLESRVFNFTTSNFTRIVNQNTTQVLKYAELYGDVEGCKTLPCSSMISSHWAPLSIEYKNGNATVTGCEPAGYFTTPGHTEECKTWAGNISTSDIITHWCNAQGVCELAAIRFQDPLKGEIVSYDSSVQLCRRIVDREVFNQTCADGKDPKSEKDCNIIKNLNVATPTYCLGAVAIPPLSDHRYRFPNLETLFAFTPRREKTMGLQDNSIQQMTTAQRLRRTENDTEIRHADDFRWAENITRTIRYKSSPAAATTTATNVTTNTTFNWTRRWRTPWQ